MLTLSDEQVKSIMDCVEYVQKVCDLEMPTMKIIGRDGHLIGMRSMANGIEDTLRVAKLRMENSEQNKQMEKDHQWIRSDTHPWTEWTNFEVYGRALFDVCSTVSQEALLELIGVRNTRTLVITPEPIGDICVLLNGQMLVAGSDFKVLDRLLEFTMDIYPTDCMTLRGFPKY